MKKIIESNETLPEKKDENSHGEATKDQWRWEVILCEEEEDKGVGEGKGGVWGGG